MVHYLRNLLHLQIVGSLFLWYFKKFFHCALIQFHTFAQVAYVQLCKNILEVHSVHVLQVSWNGWQCGLWILVNTSHFFPHAWTFFIGHIIINYPLFECGNWIHNCICAGNGHIILQTLLKLFSWDSDVEVWGKMSSHFIFSSSFYTVCLFAQYNDWSKCTSDSCMLW
jgi:hypothetical protein